MPSGRGVKDYSAASASGASSSAASAASSSPSSASSVAAACAAASSAAAAAAGSNTASKEGNAGSWAISPSSTATSTYFASPRSASGEARRSFAPSATGT